MAALEPVDNRKISHLLGAIAILSCLLQFAWFASRCFNQINFDGTAYTGIARHIRNREFYAAIDGFRSPLISWLIAAVSFVSSDFLHIGKLITLGSFLLCLAGLYAFAMSLWHSRVVASLAVLLFTLGRGLAVEAVAAITPDFLFAALVLAYFLVLLRCLRNDRWQDWFFLGLIHGLAFLAKAFALPWLALCTLVALVVSGKRWKTRLQRLVLAGLIPLIVAAGWATVLHSKYGVYTTGTQFKTNLLQWTLHAFRQPHDFTYALLRDTTKELDEYTVHDPMPPGSWPWTYHVTIRQALPKIMLAEVHNVPLVLKELTIVVTPGVLIAFVLMLAILARRRHRYPLEWRVAAVIAAGTLSLIVAYSMLVFDPRYLYPLIPLILAIAARFLVPDAQLNHSGWRRIAVALVVLGTIISFVYPSSPFRLLTRDFQVMSYQAGDILRRHSRQSRIVSIGSGPIPEHGVGWEAGYQAAYFGDQRLIATLEALPTPTELKPLAADLQKASPDAVVVWGRPNDSRYTELVQNLDSLYPHHFLKRVFDPVLGEVGAIVFTAR